ncbi:MAG: PIN domain-containing protein, partial [Halobaculum sp.]
MSVFVDTGVFYAHHDTDATRHDTAVDALTAVLQSAEYGHVMTSDYVYDEVVTLTHRRTGDVDAGVEVGRRLRG